MFANHGATHCIPGFPGRPFFCKQKQLFPAWATEGDEGRSNRLESV